MKDFGLKFNHGVEIGAHLAYIGHYKRTDDKKIHEIASEEVSHRLELEYMLDYLGEQPSPLIDESFRLVGNVIRKLCAVSPVFLLNLVARSLEIFAVFNYRRLAKKYPQFAPKLLEMAEAEGRHEDYFRRGQMRLQDSQGRRA